MRRLSEDSIVKTVADRAAKQIVRRAVLALQRLTDCKLSGEDSGLENTWDEICVQVQGEHSIFWGSYVDTVRGVLRRVIEDLLPYEREALWLQTEDGFEWSFEEAADRAEYPVRDGDIVNYVLTNYLLAAADDWSNVRIRNYLDA